MSAVPLHVASFGPSDGDEIVEASFACQFCLSASVRVEIVGDSEDDPWAICHCGHCTTPTTVLISPEQAFRLLLAPPSGPSIQFIS